VKGGGSWGLEKWSSIPLSFLGSHQAGGGGGCSLAKGGKGGWIKKILYRDGIYLVSS